MDIIDIMMVLPIALVIIALLLACTTAIVRVTRNAWVTRRRRTVDLDRRSGFGRAAGDPFLIPFGDMPTVPRERLMVARDFRAWGIPECSSSAAVAHRRNEGGGRPASVPGTAVVLSFKPRRA